MKKTTAYTLLCTTILASGISLATDNEKIDANLDANKGALKASLSEVKEESKELLLTPDKSHFLEKYSFQYSPYSADYYAEMDRRRVSASNAAERQNEQRKKHALDFESKMRALELDYQSNIKALSKEEK